MGLIEKRLIKQGREEWIPEAQKELQAVTAGSQIYEVDWDSFESDADGLNNVQNQALRRITAAFRVICRDELGKEASQEAIKKILVRNVASPSEKSIVVKDGVLVICGAWGKGGEGYFTDRDIQLAIEKQI
jgi:hypothetical protein